MNKPTSKKSRGLVSAAFLAAAAVMVMVATAGCQDTNILMKEKSDAQLINADGEAWGIVCATLSGQRCEPVATRAIAFNRNGTAIMYTVTEASWNRYTQVRWATTGNTLYITYNREVGVVRYAFVIADGLLTLRAESSTAGNHGYLTDGGAMAGYEKTRILPALPTSHPVVFTLSEGGTLSATSEGILIESGTEVPTGTVLTINATPHDGHALDTLTVNGLPFVNGATHTVNGTVVVAATFAAPVTFTAGAGGSLSVTKPDDTPITSGETVPVGTFLKVTAVPDMNYLLETLTVNGEAFVNGASFVVGGATEIAATFAVVTYPLTFTTSAGGTLSVTSNDVSIESGTAVPAGTVLTITATPNANYAMSTLTVNGQLVEDGATHTVDGEVEITATFSIPGAEAHPVTFTAGTGGTLSITRPDGALTTSGAQVPVSTALTITATPLDGYVLSTLTVNGQSVNNGATHTVNGTVMISATFAAPVTFDAGTGGTLSIVRPNGVSITSGAVVPVGTVLRVTATPNPTFILSTLTVDGQSAVNGATYTVNSPVYIAAAFAAPVRFTANAGGTLSIVRPDDVPIDSGTAVPAGTALTITATPLAGYSLSTLTLNSQPFVNGTTHTVNGAVVVAAIFATTGAGNGTGTIPDAGLSIVNDIPDVASMTAEERARYERFLSMSGEGIAFGNSWWLDDGSRFEHNGVVYSNSALFRSTGEFWQAAIPLNSSGNIDLDIPAKYINVGKYIMYGDSIHINIPELGATGEDPDLFRRFHVGIGSNGERELEMWRGKRPGSNIFKELRCVIFIVDPDITDAMLDSGLDFDNL